MNSQRLYSFYMFLLWVCVLHFSCSFSSWYTGFWPASTSQECIFLLIYKCVSVSLTAIAVDSSTPKEQEIVFLLNNTAFWSESKKMEQTNNNDDDYDVRRRTQNNNKNIRSKYHVPNMQTDEIFRYYGNKTKTHALVLVCMNYTAHC